MTDLLQLTYSDIKTVKTRSAYQLILEGPIEQMDQAMALLGPPKPGGEVWVVVARLKEGVGTIDTPQEPKAIEMKGGKLAKRAGILCTDPLFQRWIAGDDEEETAELLRLQCGIGSRAELDHDPKVADVFLDMVRSFEAWKLL